MNPAKIVLVGAGNRGNLYCEYALRNPDRMQVVGVVEPNAIRRDKAKKVYNITDQCCFSSINNFLEEDIFADAVINGTMDHLHVKTSLPILEKGYDLLLEKPYSVTKEETITLAETAEKLGRKVMICHVLRYSPFYHAIKERLLAGEIGDIISIQTTEHVSFHHMAVSYVRGKWRNKEQCHASMLLAKCCHDLDLIIWMNSGINPTSISSFGGRHFFTEDNLPENAGTRCMVDCPIEENCHYSCKKHYINHPERWKQYVWTCLEHIDNPTLEDKIHSLETDNPFGKCVWRYDNNVVDRQCVSIQFENGSIATHTMLGESPQSQRYMHIIGTKGDIRGVFEESSFTIRKINPTKTNDFTEEVIDLNIKGDMTGAFGGHGGGDMRLIEDFVSYIKNEKTSISRTTIMDSMNSHLAAFYADQAMEEKRVINF